MLVCVAKACSRAHARAWPWGLQLLPGSDLNLISSIERCAWLVQGPPATRDATLAPNSRKPAPGRSCAPPRALLRLDRAMVGMRCTIVDVFVRLRCSCIVSVCHIALSFSKLWTLMGSRAAMRACGPVHAAIGSAHAGSAAALTSMCGVPRRTARLRLSSLSSSTWRPCPVSTPPVRARCKVLSRSRNFAADAAFLPLSHSPSHVALAVSTLALRVYHAALDAHCN